MNLGNSDTAKLNLEQAPLYSICLIELAYAVSKQDSVNYSNVTLGVQLLSIKSLYIFSPFSSKTPFVLFYSTIIFLTEQLVLNSTPFF